MTTQIQKIKQLFRFKDADRTSKAKKNIVLLFIVHGFNFLALLITVPLTLDYLGPQEYGIWMTINSLLVWVGYLDLGVGNGLRVKLAESLAHNDYEKGKVYTSTSYAIFSVGMFVFFLLFLIVNQFLDWTAILNTSVGLKDELNLLVIWVLALFLLQFVLRLITFVISADQRVALTGALTLSINILSVLFLFFIDKISDTSLFNLGVGISVIPVLVFVVASYLLYKSIFKNISPSFKSINLGYSKDLVVLGGQFFVIQAAGLIIFAAHNMIITQLFGPSEVTVYNIAYRYFYFIPLLFGIFLNPILPAYTEAYAKNDLEWIKKATNKITKIWLLLSAAVIIMIVVSNIAYQLWVGDEVKIPFGLSVAMGVFVIVSNWCNIYAYFLNGVGKIRVQFYNAIFIALINIPLSVFLADNLKLGVTGVVVATTICLLIGAVLGPIQYKKILYGRSYGIWGK